MPPTTGPPASLPGDANWILHRIPIPLDSPRDSVPRPVDPGVWSMRELRKQPPLATSDITAVLENSIDPLRRLDDAEGGSAAGMDFVRYQRDTVDTYLVRGDTAGPQVRHRLLRVSAQLSQLAGWMAYDAERHAVGERYFLAALHAAREINDRDLTAYILACMARHAAYREQLGASLDLADAAVRAARDSHPAVRSVVASRMGNCQAAAGNLAGFRAASDEAKQIWATVDSAGDKPDFLYWYGEDYIDIQRSESLQLLAITLSRGADITVREADALLDDRISKQTTTMPRDVALHSAALARVHVQHGNLDRAVTVAGIALDRLGSVRSPRVLRALRSLGQELHRSPEFRVAPETTELRDRLYELTTRG